MKIIKHPTVYEKFDIPENERTTMKNLTSEDLINYMRENCVGKCNTISGQELYFIPRLQWGEVSLSIQKNYYLWKYREEHDIPHKNLVTEEEFNAVLPNEDFYCDVLLEADNFELFMGQKTVREVVQDLFTIADQDQITFEE